MTAAENASFQAETVAAAFRICLCGIVMLASLSCFRMGSELLGGTRAARIGLPILCGVTLLASLLAFVVAGQTAIRIIESLA